MLRLAGKLLSNICILLREWAFWITVVPKQKNLEETLNNGEKYPENSNGNIKGQCLTDRAIVYM